MPPVVLTGWTVDVPVRRLWRFCGGPRRGASPGEPVGMRPLIPEVRRQPAPVGSTVFALIVAVLLLALAVHTVMLNAMTIPVD